MLRLAKLLKDLPDVNAGAIFYVPSQNHQEHLEPDQPINNNAYQYFGEDGQVKINWKYGRDSYAYERSSMSSDWFSFYDYADGTWKEYHLVKIYTLLE